MENVATLARSAHPSRALARARCGRACGLLVWSGLWAGLWGCEVPSPQSPAEPIGEYPVWGRNFQQGGGAASAGPSLLSGGAAAGLAPSTDDAPPPDEGPNAAELSGPGGSATPQMKPPEVRGSARGGDAQRGQAVFLNHCARCHGIDGKGGNRPGIGMVPTLRDTAWHARTSDERLASSIAHGKKAMPAFADTLSREEIADVIAHLRTLPARPE